MINEEINIAIAEHCGWRNIKEIDYQPFGTDPYIDGPDQMLVGIHPESDIDSDECEPIPNYCKDLNEMHEALQTLISTEQQNQYINNIAEVCWSDVSRGNNQVIFNQLTSTARQQAEAFLKTIGKWEQ